ncbi:MAG: membrane protein insertase YidC [Micavibrio sp.]|nr:MAG: membrane protein insertase YidC [Micavibrio sp.]
MTPPNMPRRPEDPRDLPPGNLIIAVVLSMAVMAVFFIFFEQPRREALYAQHQAALEIEREAEELRQAEEEERRIRQMGEARRRAAESGIDFDEDSLVSEDGEINLWDLIEESEPEPEPERVSFNTARLEGSISPRGGRIDDLQLLGHYETVERDRRVSLFTPERPVLATEEDEEAYSLRRPYFAEFGWVSRDGATVPDADTVWTVEESGPVTDREDMAWRTVLSWDNGEDLIFRKIISVDHDYMFHVAQEARNYGNRSRTLHPYGMLRRHGKPIDHMGFFILYEGPMGWIDDDMEYLKYDRLNLGGTQNFDDARGWIGFTDKYWFSALIPADLQSRGNIRYRRDGTPDSVTYQTDITASGYHLPPGDAARHEMRLYAGVKDVRVLRDYQNSYGIKNLELAIDFGIWWILTKPLFLLLTWLGEVTGHIGIGILVLTVILKILTFPLTNRAFTSMSKMSILGPHMRILRERYGHNRERMQQEMLNLYQREDVNPLSGCWPMLIQIPIFFSLYKVILTNVMLRHVPFWGWIDDLSARDPTAFFNLFGLLPYNVPVWMSIGAWPCLMGLSMYWMNRMSPKPTDKMQAMLKNYFPYVFTVILSPFAAGLVIYWTWNNVLTVFQQYVIMRRLGIPVGLIRGRLDNPAAEAQELEKKIRAEYDEEEAEGDPENAESGEAGENASRKKRRKKKQDGDADRQDSGSAGKKKKKKKKKRER